MDVMSYSGGSYDLSCWMVVVYNFCVCCWTKMVWLFCGSYGYDSSEGLMSIYGQEVGVSLWLPTSRGV